MPSRNSLAKIHIAKKELGLTEEQYRAALSGFGVDSSKYLTDKEANELIEAFKRTGWKPKSAKSKSNKNKYEELRGRGEDWPNPQQLRKIDAMFMSVSRAKTEAAMNKFINRIVKVSHISMLKKDDVKKVILAIENL